MRNGVDGAVTLGSFDVVIEPTIVERLRRVWASSKTHGATEPELRCALSASHRLEEEHFCRATC